MAVAIGDTRKAFDDRAECAIFARGTLWRRRWARTFAAMSFSGSISGSTRVHYIVGDPVEQVRAPALFNPLFARHGVDAVLVPAHVRPGQLAGWVQHVLAAGNAGGLWVTVPHKAAVLPLLARTDRLAALAGAANAVRRAADGTLEGALFDGVGFVKALEGWGVAVRGTRALVVGAGGAGMAIAVSLADSGAARIVLCDIDGTRVAAMAHRLRHAYPALDVQGTTAADPGAHDLLVNATPLGLQPGDALPFDAARVRAGADVVDILMKNQHTPLLQTCAARGARVHTGYEMMFRQAPDYLRYFGLPELAQALEADPQEWRRLIDA
jgi:shikimate dehydrogenase